MTNLKLKCLLFTTLFTLSSAVYSDTISSISYEDRMEIMSLLAQFPHTFDNGEAEAYVSLFAPNAVVALYYAGNLVSENVPIPPAEVFKASFETQKENGVFKRRHFLTNIILEYISDDKVRARSSFTMTIQKDDPSAPVIAGTGEFRDTFLRTSTGWKFSRHEIHSDRDALGQSN